MKNLMFRQVEQESFDKLKTEWKKITDTLEKIKEKPLRFLRYFIMANYNVKNAKGEEIIREDEIYEWITKKENVQQCNYEEKPFEFVKFMQANVEAYAMFLNGKDKEGNDNVYLDNIQRLSGSFRQHLMLLLAAKNLDKELFVHLARQIEVLIIHYIVTREPTREFERKFSRWAKEIKKINNKESLNFFIENTLRSEVQSKAKDFENAMLQFDSHTLQQYRLRYMLAKLTQYVDQQVLGSYEDTNLAGYITKGIEIEHILPQTPNSDLRKAFGEDYDDYKIKLGNLTLLEKPMNIVASNDFFENKKPMYKTSKFYLTRSMAQLDTVGVNSSVTRINQSLKSFEKWDKESIIERQQMLLGLAKRIWKVEKIQ
jgi:Asp-tRNA(Asn)/Glu-tRNA(Gln) amidotransferase C subunit